jgi:hypothetical protein
MKAKFYIILSILCILYSCNKQQNCNLILIAPKYDFQDSLYITKEGNTYYLPTQYASDTIITAKENVISENGDTIHKIGDEVTLTNISCKHDTSLEFKDDGIYISSTRPLINCQINIAYTENAIFNKAFNSFSDRSNKVLDFLKKEKERYIYFAPYSKWETGGYDKFESMTIFYRPELKLKTKYFIDENEIYFNKSDFEKLFPHFKAYLIQ